MNSEAIAKEMELVFLRCRAGLISADRAAKEIGMLETMLRACGQVDLERKLDALQATLAARNWAGQAAWLTGARLTSSWSKTLTGKEIARLALQNYMDEQAGRQPTFSAADLERARATLRGRPEEAAIYNAWIEAARIVDYTSLEAIGKALEAEKRLIWVISSILGLLRHGLLRHARQRATRILTPAEWATFPARREQARRARMAEEKISFAEVTRSRAWWLAPEELKARARSLPDFDDESGSAYDYLLRLDAAAARAAPPDSNGGGRGADQGSKASVCPQRQECLGQAQGWQAREPGW